MNPSRNSYSFPVDCEKAYIRDLILYPCEFCYRTFIPDSLVKHRKVCYRNFLKTRKNAKRQSKSLKSHPTSSHSHIPEQLRSMIFSNLKEPEDPAAPFLKLTKLMRKRQERRMNWRSRHDEFINTIRYAREYTAAIKAGITPPKPPVTSASCIDLVQKLEKCRYCLRKFNKDAYAKHIKICREHSLQSNRTFLNKDQIEAKRRLSLRLYYKPHTYRGDSPDDCNDVFSSNETDCTSIVSRPSMKTASDKSKLSQRISLSSRINWKTESKKVPGKRKVYSKRRNSESKADKSLLPRNNKPPASNEDTISNQNLSANFNNAVLRKKYGFKKRKARRSRSRSLNQFPNSKCMNQRVMKNKGPNFIKNRVPYSSCDDDDEPLTNFTRPNPVDSLRQAKRVLSFLMERSKERELLKQALAENVEQNENHCCDDKIIDFIRKDDEPVNEHICCNTQMKSISTELKQSEEPSDNIEITKLSLICKSNYPAETTTIQTNEPRTDEVDESECNEKFVFTKDELKCIKRWENFQKYQESKKLNQVKMEKTSKSETKRRANYASTNDEIYKILLSKKIDNMKDCNDIGSLNQEVNLTHSCKKMANDYKKPGATNHIDTIKSRKVVNEDILGQSIKRKFLTHPDPDYANIWNHNN